MNGAGWALQVTPNHSGAQNSALASVSCTSATACTAVGGYVNSGGTLVTLAEVWDGSSWTIQTTPNPSGATKSFLEGVSCLSTTVCRAVGYYFDSGGNQLTLAEFWNGSTWAIQATPNPNGGTFVALNGVACTTSMFAP